MSDSLAGKTILMSGGSRGIGLAIALRAARDGANVTLLAKTGAPHPKLEGTVFTAASQIEKAGGKAVAEVGDVREESDVRRAVDRATDAFGGIDIVVNNASAIDQPGTERLDMKRYDLMQDINTRGTFLLTKAALPHLRAAANPHVLTLSPPLNMAPHWLGQHVGYMLSKYGMTFVHAGDRCGGRRRGHRGQLLVAPHPDQHGRGEERHRRCRQGEESGDRRRRRACHPRASGEGVHRQRLHGRRGTGRRGDHGPVHLRPRRRRFVDI